jgi:hypothetical protein
VAISRGPARSIPVPPGQERAVFLREVGSLLEVDASEVDVQARLVEMYGVDELEVFEYVQIAEDIWHVELNPNPMSDADFASMVARFTTLESIATAADAARR